MRQSSIYSTLTSDVQYTFYNEADNETGVRTPNRMIQIAGKANLAGQHFITPRGGVTAVTEEEVTMLMQHPVFQKHMENGFVTIERRGTDLERVTSDMVPRDESAPLEPGDFDENGPQPTVAQTQSRAADVAPPSATHIPGGAKKSRRANTSKDTLAKTK